jgi:hypothetical protein
MVEFLMTILANFLEILISALLIFLGVKLSSFLSETRVGKKVETFVKAAEKLKETGQISDKPAYVSAMLNLVGIEITAEIQAMIEAACKDIDIQSFVDIVADPNREQ